MNPNDIVAKVAAALDRAQIPFMLVGSFSSNAYGIERTTQDADFVLTFESHSIADLIRELGPDFKVESQLGFETVTMTSRYIATHRTPVFKIELFLLGDDPHDVARFARRKTGTIGNQPIPLPTPEDVVITKLRWSRLGKRSKDIHDAQNVLAVQQGKLDLEYIRHWCDQHATRDLLESTLASIPPLPPQ